MKELDRKIALSGFCPSLIVTLTSCLVAGLSVFLTSLCLPESLSLFCLSERLWSKSVLQIVVSSSHSQMLQSLGARLLDILEKEAAMGELVPDEAQQHQLLQVVPDEAQLGLDQTRLSRSAAPGSTIQDSAGPVFSS